MKLVACSFVYLQRMFTCRRLSEPSDHGILQRSATRVHRGIHRGGLARHCSDHIYVVLIRPIHQRRTTFEQSSLQKKPSAQIPDQFRTHVFRHYPPLHGILHFLRDTLLHSERRGYAVSIRPIYHFGILSTA